MTTTETKTFKFSVPITPRVRSRGSKVKAEAWRSWFSALMRYAYCFNEVLGHDNLFRPFDRPCLVEATVKWNVGAGAVDSNRILLWITAIEDGLDKAGIVPKAMQYRVIVGHRIVEFPHLVGVDFEITPCEEAS